MGNGFAAGIVRRLYITDQQRLRRVGNAKWLDFNRCGVRSIRNYKHQVGENALGAGSNPASLHQLSEKTMNFTFTKKGPGRRHNHSGAEKRFKGMNIVIERQERQRICRFSNKFIKAWKKYQKTFNYPLNR